MQINILPSNNNKYNYYENTPSFGSSSVTAAENNAVSVIEFLSGVSALNQAEISIKKSDEDKFFNDFLNREGKLTREEYEDVIKNHPSVIMKAQDFVAKNYKGESSPRDVAENTLRVDRYLKQVFNGNLQNFRIISIGTSPSPITEQLANMGHDVVFLPLSGLRLGYKKNKTKLGNSADLRAIMQYLDTKNIDDGKVNVVLDFTSSGTTLNVITKFIKQYFGFTNKNIMKISLGEDILDAYYDDRRDRYIRDMLGSKVEEISNVPHFPVTPNGTLEFGISNKENSNIILLFNKDIILFDKETPKKELFEKFENYSSPVARAFALCTMAQVDKLRNNAH